MASSGSKRQLEEATIIDGDREDDLQAKRMRILEETRDVDADSSGSEDDSSNDERLMKTMTLGTREF